MKNNRVYLNKFDGFEFEFHTCSKRSVAGVDRGLELHIAGSASTPTWVKQNQGKSCQSFSRFLNVIKSPNIYSGEKKKNYKKEPPRKCTSF